MDISTFMGSGRFVVAKPTKSGMELMAGDIDILDALRFESYRPTRVSDRLYEILYPSLNYAYGLEHGDGAGFHAGCSAARAGSLVGGNLDWYYDDGAEILIKTPARDGRYATMGVAHTIPGLEKAVLDSGQYREEYKLLPFMVNSCINSCGVYAKANVVWGGDRGRTTGTNPEKLNLCQLHIVRYVCDYAASADEAVSLLEDMNIYSADSAIGDELHFMIADASKTYIVEFVDNEMVVTEDVVMTNFYQADWTGDIKSVMNGDTEEEVLATGLNPHAEGLERMDILLSGIESVADEDDMVDLMKSVYFTQAYDENNAWYSEFVGDGRTIFSPAEDYEDIMSAAAEAFADRQRDGQTWQTCHTAVFDIANKTVSVYVEEDYDHKYEFELHVPGTV